MHLERLMSGLVNSPGAPPQEAHPEGGEIKMQYIFSNPKYVRAMILTAVFIIAIAGLFAIVDPTFAGNCPAPSIPVCP